jgi:hypothetical protein
MLDSSFPLSFIKVCSFLSTIAVNLVILPFPLEDPSIGIVKSALSILLPIPHLSFIPLPIAGYEYALSAGHVVLPLSQVDIQIGGLEYPGPVLAIVLDFSLIGLAVGVLNGLHIFEVFSIGAVDVPLQERVDDALLLLLQARGVDGAVLGWAGHNG